jgi:hypothetical protein
VPMRTLTPLERRVLSTLDSSGKRWWEPAELWEAMDGQEPYVSIVSSLASMRHRDLVTRHRKDYSITTLGAAEIGARS